MSVEKHDDNAVILDRLRARLQLGLENYGHGVQVNTKRYNWMEMAEEEVLDGLIYAMSAIIRHEKKMEEDPDGFDARIADCQKRHDTMVERCDNLIGFILSNHEPSSLPNEIHQEIDDHINEGKPE